MENKNVSVNINGGVVNSSQIGDNRNAKMIVNSHPDAKEAKLEELKQKLSELIRRIETATEIDEETKDEYLMSISGAKSQIENGKCTPGILKGLNKRLTEFSGIVAGISALGDFVSATVSVVEALLKSS